MGKGVYSSSIVERVFYWISMKDPDPDLFIWIRILGYKNLFSVEKGCDCTCTRMR
jgi:hypothetical protein